MISIAAPVIGEEEQRAVAEVLASGNLAQGEIVRRFEDGFASLIGARHAVAVSSGTAALHLALLAKGIGPGDEVITTPFTFVATANAVLFTGARPVFVDIDPVSFNIDPGKVEEAITPRTRALLPVHLYGQAADMPRLGEIARKHGLWLLEDACQSHLALYDGRAVGSVGTACFSFYPTKNITTGEGGVVTTDDEEIAESVRLLRNHGQRVRYYHEVLGYNQRMTDLHAAIGCAQLPKLAAFNERRRANATFLSEHLEGVLTPVTSRNCQHVFNQFTVRVPGGQRDRLADGLRAAGVGTAIYYPVPIHRQKTYLDQCGGLRLVEAERASEEVLSLPVHPRVTRDDLTVIADEVNALMASLSATGGRR